MGLRRRWWFVVAGLCCLALLGPGCGMSSGTDSSAPDAAEETDPPPDSDVDGGPLDTKAVLDQMRGSVALIVTPSGTGSSVLIDGGYLVTNAHVVDPYNRVDVVFEGRGPIEGVEVVGVDLRRDIALVGPVDTTGEAQEIVPSAGVEQGSDLYLVGFPGEQADLQATISRGVLSRRRAITDWGLELIQSDATIGAGQSGGALVDERGRVVGISGMRDPAGFALSLDGADVQAAIDRIRGDEGSRWLSVAPDGELATLDVLVRHVGGMEVFHVPAADRKRELRVHVDDPAVGVGLVDAEGWVQQGNQPLLDGVEAETFGMFRGTGFLLTEAYLADVVDRSDDGWLTFTVEPGWEQFIVTGSHSYGARYSVEISEPVTHIDRSLSPGQVSVGGSREGELTSLVPVERVFLELTEGQSVEVIARSPFGDMAFMLVTPEDITGESDGPGYIESNDGGGGAFGADDILAHTATSTGRHAVDVYTVDGVATEYRLEVTATN